jgi:hypothetical protein
MNKPITMRVRQATNGNKGVQEPLLDVGAAGVRGGAATRKQPSPLKANMDPQPKEETTKVDATESAGAIATGNTTNVADDKKDPETKKDSKDSGLAEGAEQVAGEITRATDIKTEDPPKSESKRSGRTIGDAFQDNMVARIDKAGELGRARREARRNKKAGISESEASSASSAPTVAATTQAPSTNEVDELLNDLDTKGKLGAPVNMRMNANIGMKSKSPMKKGYFKGM